MEDTKNIVEICKNILCTKAKYFYDEFYSNKSLKKNIMDYVRKFNNYIEHDFMIESNPELEKLNISKEKALAIMKLIIYSQAYLSYAHKNLIDEDPDELFIMETIETLSLSAKISSPISLNIIKEFIEFEIEISYFERHSAYEDLLDKEILSKYLIINPFGVLIASELIQKLTEEEILAFNITVFYLDVTAKSSEEAPSFLYEFHEKVVESDYQEEFVYEYIIAEVYKYLIIKKHENDISDEEELIILYIETNDIMDIIEEMKGDDEERKQHPEDYDSFAEYIIDTFYQIKINLQRDTAEKQNLEFKETGKEDIYQDLNPFLRR